MDKLILIEIHKFIHFSITSFILRQNCFFKMALVFVLASAMADPVEHVQDLVEIL